MTAPVAAPAAVSPDAALFGVTVKDVQSLLPRSKLDDEDTENRVPGAALGITSSTVGLWIELVAAEVATSMPGWERIENPVRAAYIQRAARAIVINGVAAYWERANTQQRNTGPSTYYTDLWARYQAMLTPLTATVTGWLADLTPGDITDPGLTLNGPSGSFPPPTLGDGYPSGVYYGGQANPYYNTVPYPVEGF
ncbi:MAG: hypothetical protein M3Y35_01920 [Actinomycetota bacterium]|nr:hypothetical protein [Actinomycetota bacterium]